MLTLISYIRFYSFFYNDLCFEIIFTVAVVLIQTTQGKIIRSTDPSCLLDKMTRTVNLFQYHIAFGTDTLAY